ncbi:MAG: hypothetical protein QG564_219 [Campylobacterota bacterium]|nr:hypothetical protein [Campylobacterota bacterium]
MKLTKLSLMATAAISVAAGGGDIAPLEPLVEASAAINPTTISGKFTGYYITDDSTDDLFGDHHQLALGATLDVSHKFTDWLSANFSAIGYLNTLNAETYGYFENDKKGAYFNIANLTASYDNTSLAAGRQLLGTPMLQGYDWLLAPGSFEAYTLTNSSIENLTLVGSYVTKHRANNSGEFGNDLDGDNYAFGAAYDNKTIIGSIWYYNIDAFGDYIVDETNGKYTQFYADLGYDFGAAKVEVQFANTDYDSAFAEDSNAFGAKISTSVSGVGLSAGYNHLTDNVTGYVGWNNLYTNSWNSSVADQWISGDIDAFKVAASKSFDALSTEVSYASYDNDRYEADVILGYEVSKSIDLGIVYSNTQSIATGDADVNQFELYANYKF